MKTKKLFSTKLAKEVFTWLEEKGINVVRPYNQIMRLSREYDQIHFDDLSEDMSQDERCEFFGVLIDIAEDFLEEIGVTTDWIPNEEREDECSALIYGSDYDDLTGRFAKILGIAKDSQEPDIPYVTEIAEKIIKTILENIGNPTYSEKQEENMYSVTEELLEEYAEWKGCEEKNPILHEDEADKHLYSEYLQLMKEVVDLSDRRKMYDGDDSVNHTLMLMIGNWLHSEGEFSPECDIADDLFCIFEQTSDPQSFLYYFYEITGKSFWKYLLNCEENLFAAEKIKPVKQRKVLIHAGNASQMAYLFIADTPNSVLTEWCMDHAMEGNELDEYAFGELEDGYRLKMIYTPESDMDPEDIEIIGYDEEYDIRDYKPDSDAENQKVIDAVSEALEKYDSIDVCCNDYEGTLDVMHCTYHDSFPVATDVAKISRCDKKKLIQALDAMDVGHVGF